MNGFDNKAGVVIIGAGQAGGELSTELRKLGYAGAVTLIGDEPYVPYRRPPLSKDFLAGNAAVDSLYLKPIEAYAKHAIDCRLGTGVENIDRGARNIRLDDGSLVAYEHLILATGGRARRLSLPGADHPNVHYVRTIADIVRLQAQFKPGKRLLIIGGGYIGLEAASVGVKKALHVTVIEALPRVLARVTAPELSTFYETSHRRRGVDVRTGVGVRAFEGDELVDTVVLADGTRIATDLVIVGVGLIPNTELAEAAGLEAADGIVVDAYMRTRDPQIYAIGDCASRYNEFLRRRVRLESVPNATEHARICAAVICGRQIPMTAVPWFWSDQYDLKLQMVGLSQGYDEVAIRGTPAGESFCAFYLREGVLISADTVNRPQEFMLAKKLVADGARLSADALADERLPLKALLQPAAS